MVKKFFQITVLKRGLPLFLLAIVKYGSLPVSRLLFVPFDTKTGAKINCHIKLPCIDLG